MVFILSLADQIKYIWFRLLFLITIENYEINPL